MNNEMINTYSPFTDAINNRFPLVNAIIVKENKDRNLCINNYILHRQIGRGSYAQVRLARDVYQEEDVALRILNRKQLSRKLGAIKRADAMINNSLKIMALLDTKYIIQCKEFLYTNILLYDLSQQTKYLPISHELAKQFVGLPQIIGQLAEQEDSEIELFQQQITPRFTQDTDNMQNVCVFVLEKADSNLIDYTSKANYNSLRSYIYQSLCGLNHLHQNRVVYNDFKAENLLIFAEKNQLKLSDFDTSTILPDTQTTMTLDQVYQIEDVKLGVCNNSRGLQNGGNQNNYQQTKNLIVSFPQETSNLIVDQMLYSFTVSEIGFQTPGITAPESRSGSVHIGELSDVWQFGQLLLNVFLGIRANIQIQRHSANERLITQYYNEKLTDLISGSTLPQTLRYNSYEAVRHPFFTNSNLDTFRLQRLESKFNDIVLTLQKHNIQIKRSVSTRSQTDHLKKQKILFNMLRQGLLKTFNIDEYQDKQEAQMLQIRKLPNRSQEIHSGIHFDDLYALGMQTKQLLNYLDSVSSNQEAKEDTPQGKSSQRSHSVPINSDVRRKVSIQEFIQSSYSDKFSMQELEQLCAKSIKYLDVRGYKDKRSKVIKIRKQLEMQQLVKLCIYINYYKFTNHIGQHPLNTNDDKSKVTLPEYISSSLSVKDYVSRILCTYDENALDQLQIDSCCVYQKRNIIQQQACSQSNNSNTIQSTTQIFKTNDIPAVPSQQQIYNDMNIQQYDQIISDESDVDLTFKYEKKFTGEQKVPPFGLHLPLQLPRSSSKPVEIDYQSNQNLFLSEVISSNQPKFDKTKLGFKINDSPFTNQSVIHEDKKTDNLSSLGFKPNDEVQPYNPGDVSQYPQLVTNLSGNLTVLCSNSKSQSFINPTIGSSEYTAQNEITDELKQNKFIKRSSMVQQLNSSDGNQIAIDDILTIQSCVESSCIVDAKVYDDIGECSLSSDF